jgi:hypothetical protein
VRIALARQVGLFAMLLLLPALASAQSGSGIAGVVKDSSGAVLPGVTVEAASPALIEKVRTVVTDGGGQYKIVGLVPGTYSVTFTLNGFNAIKRDGIDLTASFTATVNADLRVGAVTETVTVTGAAPTVDIQNVVQQRVLTRDIIDNIPGGSKTVAALGVLIPGVISTATQDVGGIAFSATAISVHGGRSGEQQLLYDGVAYHNGQGSGGLQNTIVPNDATVQEISIETGGAGAESPNGGVRTNIIPRDGGNTFRGFFFGTFTNGTLQSDNLNDAIKASGLVSVPHVTRIYDVDPAFGGPLRKDQLWFYGSVRKQNSQQTVVDRYFNLTPAFTPGIAPAYTPDFGSQAQNNEENGNQSLRLTWQVNAKNKLAVQGQTGQQVRPYYTYALGSTLVSPEASWYSESRPMYLVQSSWSAPLTSRLLLEATAGGTSKNFETYLQPGANPLQPAWTEATTGVSWGNYASPYGANANFQFNSRLIGSYVTGAHAAKFGISFIHASSHRTQSVVNNAVTYRLNGGLNAATGVITGAPTSVTAYATPTTLDAVLRADVGLFAQDQWTIRRLTLNLGVRFDSYNAYVPAQHLSPGPNVPTRSVDFAEIDGVANWKNTSPRLGASYDLFGTGKTAVKVSLGRYPAAPLLTTITGVVDPANAVVNTATRTWNDRGGLGIDNDFVPQPSELGPIVDPNFGTPNITQGYGPNVQTTRGYNWEGSVSVQQEVAKNVSVNVAYFRRAYGNLTTTQNTRVTNASYSTYCIAVPTTDPRLTGLSSQLCGLYDRNDRGANFTLTQLSDLFGKQEDVFDGVDFNVNARMPRGIVAQGGVSTGRERTNNCYALNDLSLGDLGTGTPHTEAYCDVRPPFQPNVKGLFVYPLPWWGLQTSATYQGRPGQQILATAVIANAAIAPSLGRNLISCPAPTGACTSTASVSLIPPGTQYAARINQVDFRISKVVKLPQGRRVQGIVDIYNVFNGAAVITQSNSFGTTWQRPTAILQARLVKFGFQLDF